MGAEIISLAAAPPPPLPPLEPLLLTVRSTKIPAITVFTLLDVRFRSAR